MKKIRIVSDLHLDINNKYPLELKDKNIFTILCGDTAGYPDVAINWINENLKAGGILISGNHMPYNDSILTMQELREKYAQTFPESNNITYFDSEIGVVSKVVDNILFVGSCFYTDMAIKDDFFNPTGDIEFNKRASAAHMNDYYWGHKTRSYPFGIDNDPKFTNISPDDYIEWFHSAFEKIDKILTENESKEIPLPVVLFSHHPLIASYFGHNFYVDEDRSPRYKTYNRPSYASDYEKWLKSHNSIKVYACGHIHDVEFDYRQLKLKHDDDSEFVVINNARGYVFRGHDYHFKPELVIDTDTWSVEIPEETENEKQKKQETLMTTIKNNAWSL